MAAELQEVVDTGDFELGPLQMEGMVLDIAAGFLPERATGVSLGDLLPPARSAVQEADTSAGSSGSAAVSKAGNNNVGALGFFFQFVWLRQQSNEWCRGDPGRATCSTARPPPPSRREGAPTAEREGGSVSQRTGRFSGTV